MSLLDGMQELFGEVFADIFYDGTLHKITLVDNGKGGYTSTPQDHPIKVLTESCTEEMRSEADFSEKDVALIILQHQVAGVKLDSDDKVTDGFGAVWAIKAPIKEDPVQAAWIARGSPV